MAILLSIQQSTGHVQIKFSMLGSLNKFFLNLKKNLIERCHEFVPIGVGLRVVKQLSSCLV